MKSHKHYLLAATCALALLSNGRSASGQAGAPTIPLVPGLTIVIAAHDTPPADAPRSTIVQNIAQGDSELVVTVTGVDARGIDEVTSIEGVDDNRRPLQLTIRRHVLAADLAGAHFIEYSLSNIVAARDGLAKELSAWAKMNDIDAIKAEKATKGA